MSGLSKGTGKLVFTKVFCCCCLVAQLCHTLWRPHGLQPTRLFCPWDFPWQEYWSGLPFPSPGDLPDPAIKPSSPALQADALPSEPPGKAVLKAVYKINFNNTFILSNISEMSFFQHEINTKVMGIFYFFFSILIINIWCVFFSFSISLATW